MSDIDFAFISAKLHGLRAKMVDRENIPPLLQARNVGDLSSRLGNTVQVESHQELERRTVEGHVETLSRIRVLLGGPRGRVLEALLARYALENLKMVGRAVVHPEYRARLGRLLVKLPPAIEIDLDAALKAQDLAEFVEAIPVAGWQASVRAAIAQIETAPTGFLVETALDRGYWREVHGQLKGLGSDERDKSTVMLDFELDMARLLVALRASRNYEMHWNEVRKILPPGGHRTPDRLLESVVRSARETGQEAELVGDLVRRMHVPYARADFADLETFESACWTRLYEVAKRYFYNSFDDFGIVMGFFFLKRIELRNIVCLIESVRYGLGPDQIRPELIPPRSGEG